MLNSLSAFIPDTERLITIEDAAELQLQQPHVARMETRPPNIEGKGEIRQRDLVKNALRMRPERIILLTLQRLQAESGGRSVPTVTLYGHVLEQLDVGPREFQALLGRLVARLRGG
jgi:type IV secretory pathway ATPase VirB11/archaellum biosynthesis ATPase